MPQSTRPDTPIRPEPAGAQVWLRRVLVASIAAPVALFAVVAWCDHHRLIDEATGNAQRTAAVLREHALKALETSELLVRELDLRVRQMSWDEIRTQADRLSEEMRAMHDGMPQISALALTDAEGKQWAASVALSVPGHGYNMVADREFWSAQRLADQGTFVSRSYLGNQTKRLNFGISRRRSTPTGAFDGTVHAAITITYFTDFWKEATGNQPGMSVALIRKDGEMLARLPELEGPLPRLITSSSPLMRSLQTQPDQGVYRTASSVDGVDRIYAYARVGHYPLVVGYGISSAAVLAVWAQHLMILGGFCFLAAGALAVVVLLAMRQTRHLVEEQTRRAAAEASARQAQRMELLGQLAASVAHDFANVGQAVIGAAELIERSADLARIRSLAGTIRMAAARGQALTRRMLDFARRDGIDGGSREAVSDPADVISGVCDLMSRTLGQAHRLRCEIHKEGLPAQVRGARGDLEAALMNLAANARDAMPAGGEVTVRVASERITDGHPAKLAPGLYARVSVSDIGEGMPPEILARAGEAFFTTKPRGKGTGLGLSGARGFAEGVGGALQVVSELGRGTTVTFWLPELREGAEEDGASNITLLRPQ